MDMDMDIEPLEPRILEPRILEPRIRKPRIRKPTGKILDNRIQAQVQAQLKEKLAQVQAQINEVYAHNKQLSMADNETKYNDMAKQLLKGIPVSNIAKNMNHIYFASKTYRPHLTSHATPDSECAGLKSGESGDLHHYKGLFERQITGASTHGNILKNGETVKVSNIKVEKGKTVEITADFKGLCGTCWLCAEPVHYYVGRDIHHEGATSTCGECDHVGAIVASALAGMLKSQDYIAGDAGYKVSHIHCNQQKKNTITMKFDKNKQEWIVDEGGITKILRNILGSQINGNEYDPQYIDWFEQYSNGNNDYKTEIQTQMINSIRRHTQEWCTQANEYLKTKNQEKKGDIASALVQILLNIDETRKRKRKRSLITFKKQLKKEELKITKEQIKTENLTIKQTRTVKARRLQAFNQKRGMRSIPGGHSIGSYNLSTVDVPVYSSNIKSTRPEEETRLEAELAELEAELAELAELEAELAELETELETELEAELAELEAKEQKLIKEEQDLIEQVQKDYNEVYAENSTLVEEVLTNLSEKTGGVKQSRKSKSNKNKTKKNKSNKNKTKKNKSNKNKSNKNKTNKNKSKKR